jgi:hypothetical protein
MGDHHGAAAVPTFPVALYVILISYFALLLVPFMLACLYLVKLSCAYVLHTLVTKLIRKLLNILTHNTSVAELLNQSEKLQSFFL